MKKIEKNIANLANLEETIKSLVNVNKGGVEVRVHIYGDGKNDFDGYINPCSYNKNEKTFSNIHALFNGAKKTAKKTGKNIELCCISFWSNSVDVQLSYSK